MKILVTGGAGFIGSNFIIYWLKHHPNDEIVNLDRLTYAGNLENLAEVENNPNYTFVKGDICDPRDVEKAMQGVDLVVHFAAESHVDRAIMDPYAFLKTNIIGTNILLEQALKHKIRFHHISTDEVFGTLALEDTTKFNESTPYNPRNPYATSKAASDHLVRSYYYTHGLPATISNCSNNFGPYQFPEKLIPLAITNVLDGKEIPIYGDGLYVRDWLYVIDHCKAIERIIEKGKIGETYCIGGMTSDVSNLEVIRRILKILGKGEDLIKFVKDRPGHDRRYSVDWSKIRTELGWQPEHDFDVWLSETIEWYKKNEKWSRRVKAREYPGYYQKQQG